MTRSGRRTIFMLVIAAMAVAGAAQQQDHRQPRRSSAPSFAAARTSSASTPTRSKDGKIVEGLKPGDFEVFEDGKPQAIESFDFVRFDTFTPEAERREPNSQREGFDKAADPRYRVFVIVVDMAQFAGRVRTTIYWIQQPLVHFLDRVLGSRDLYGFLTTRNSVEGPGARTEDDRHRVAGQGSVARSMNIDRDDRRDDWLSKLLQGRPSALNLRYRADQTYTALEGVVQQLGSIRQERKNIVFVTNVLPRARPDVQNLQKGSGNADPPSIGITNGRSANGDRTASRSVRQRSLLRVGIRSGWR